MKYKNVFDNPKYYNQETGEINWPIKDGFDGDAVVETLTPGTRIDRYGSVFEVVKPIDVKAGKIASWFDEIGGGTQYLMPDTIDELLDAGIIRRIN